MRCHFTRLYVIGPVSGRKDNNVHAFTEAALALEEAGYVTTIPHEFVGPNDNYPLAMRKCLYYLLDNAGGVAMLDGWQHSKGATLEHDVAIACGIPCKLWSEWLNPLNYAASPALQDAAQPVFQPVLKPLC